MQEVPYLLQISHNISRIRYKFNDKIYNLKILKNSMRKNNRLATSGLAVLLSSVSLAGCVSDEGQHHRRDDSKKIISKKEPKGYFYGYFKKDGQLYFQDGLKRFYVQSEDGIEWRSEMTFDGKNYTIYVLGPGLRLK